MEINEPIMPDYKRIPMKKGSIGEEIERLMESRVVDGYKTTVSVPVMLPVMAISFVHFVLTMLVYGRPGEEPADLIDVWNILSGNDSEKHIGLLHSLAEFIPYWLDEPLESRVKQLSLEGLVESWNNLVWKKGW